MEYFSFAKLIAEAMGTVVATLAEDYVSIYN